MSNLTLSENLVSVVPLAPIPGHALVVYKQVNGVRTFFAELDPDQQFREEKTNWWKRLLSDPPSYTAYAVNLNEQLGLKFTRRVLLQNQVDFFDLIYRLRYHVASARKVVQRLAEDPLSKLQDEIDDLVGEVVKNADWDSVLDNFNLVADDTIRQTRDEIDEVAARWGIVVDSLKLDRQLPEGVVLPGLTKREKELEIERRRIEADAEKKRLNIEHQTDIHKVSLDHDATVYREGLEAKRKDAQHGHTLRDDEREYERKQLEIKHKDKLSRQEEEARLARMLMENMLSDNDLMRQIKAGGADAAVEAFKNIAGETNSPRQLEEVFNVLKRLKQFSGGEGGAGTGAADAQALRGMDVPVALLQASNGEAGSLPKAAQLLTSTFKTVAEINYTTPEKTRLLSALIHLAAEAMLGDEADDEKLKAYRDSLQEVVAKLSFLPDELEEFIKQNYRGLKEQMK